MEVIGTIPLIADDRKIMFRPQCFARGADLLRGRMARPWGSGVVIVSVLL